MRNTSFSHTKSVSSRSALMKVVFSLVWILAAGHCGYASLVITLYHHDNLYIASDSRMSYIPSGEAAGTARKIFKISDTCCVAVTGLGGYDLTNFSGKSLFTLSLPRALENLCAMQITNPVPLERKMELIALAFKGKYQAAIRDASALPHISGNPEPTRLGFAGYNPEKRCFFTSSCLIEGTNALHIELLKQYTGATDPDAIYMQGQARFLMALLKGEPPELVKLLSPEALETATGLESTDEVPDKNVEKLILEMFRLHTENAVRLGYEKEGVGPPYRVYKVTREKITELNSPVETPPPARPAEAIATENADDKAIDLIMKKLETSFVASDYSYTFEVMYKPFAEQIGDKNQQLAAAKLIIDQMKQQKIVMISWKTTKPYKYIKGTSRTYAVIPYESVMTIAGKKIKQESYQLGIKGEDSKWQFANGDNLNSKMFETYFPDFPKSIELPPVHRFYE